VIFWHLAGQRSNPHSFPASVDHDHGGTVVATTTSSYSPYVGNPIQKLIDISSKPETAIVE